MTDHVGAQFGNYRLLQLLGRGGFAEVYLGEHIHLGTQAAVKVLSMQLTAEGIEQFRNEARLIAHFEHPHIVRVFDFGLEGTIPFFMMTYASGGTLRQKHPKGSPIPLALIVSYSKQIASALQYAHSHKRIHRDIKPENMLVSVNGDILLSDFGIAVVSQSSHYQGLQEVGGTVAYMAPEQLNGKAVTVSDQYALGIVLYEWLSGNVPFKGSFTEICSQHFFTAPPSLRKELPTLPAAIEDVVLRALAKDPGQRYPSVEAFAEAFAHASQGVQDDQSTFIKDAHVTKPLNLLPPPPAKQGLLAHSVVPSAYQQSGKGNMPPQKAPQLLRRINNKGYIAVIAVLVSIILVMGARGSDIFNVSTVSGTPSTSALSNATQQSSTVTATASGLSTPSPTSAAPTPTPTPVTKTIAENIPIPCISRDDGAYTCDNVGLRVQLNKIEIDPSYGPQGRITFSFTLTNKASQPCEVGFIDSSSGVLISLKDPEGTSTQANGGTFLGYNSLGTGQSLSVAATLPLTPQNGMIYLLNMRLYVSGAGSDGPLTYETTPIQFSY